MNENEKLETKCPHCGAGMKAFWHRLSPGLVAILIQCIEFVAEKGRNEFHYMHDLRLSHTQAANFQKLRFHALLAKKDGKPGHWVITARGGQFLRGEIAVPERVLTFRNQVTGHSSELIHIRDLRGKIPEFEQEFAWEIPRPLQTTAPAQSTLI